MNTDFKIITWYNLVHFPNYPSHTIIYFTIIVFEFVSSPKGGTACTLTLRLLKPYRTLTNLLGAPLWFPWAKHSLQSPLLLPFSLPSLSDPHLFFVYFTYPWNPSLEKYHRHLYDSRLAFKSHSLSISCTKLRLP